MVLVFGIAVVSTALLSVLATATISRLQFTRFALAGDRNQAEALAPVIESLYLSFGNWDDVSSGILGRNNQGSMMGRMMGGMMNQNAPSRSTMQMMMWLPTGTRMIVVDNKGTIVLDTYRELTGTNVPFRLIEAGIPISSDGTALGSILVGSMIERSLSSLEADYLRSIMLALLAIMVPAVLMTTFLTSRFASRLTTPIVEMGKTAGLISNGDLTGRVKETGIGEIKALTRLFNEMGEALERSDNQKKQMIADISHELRTPLTLIRGNLEAMLDSVFPLDRSSVETIHAQAIQLELLIDDLRSLSLLDVGELDLRDERFDITEMLRAVVNGFMVEADAKRISLKYEIPANSASVDGDFSRLSQVLRNLIGNAIRHTPAGGAITVSEKQLKNGWVVVEVTDDGEGIPSSDLVRVFDRFYRSDQSRTRITGGTGLGLTISKKLVEAQGGEIGVRSEPGHGSCFWFSLPRSI